MSEIADWIIAHPLESIAASIAVAWLISELVEKKK
jgi:hypothetical protein